MNNTTQTALIALATAIPAAALSAWAAAWVAAMQERGKHEGRIDARIETLFKQYETRLEDLERQVTALEAKLLVEREERKLAELTAQAAHMRADDADAALRVEREERKLVELTAQAAHLRADDSETRLRDIKTQMLELTSERDNLSRQCGDQTGKIVALARRVADLEAEILRLETIIHDSK